MPVVLVAVIDHRFSPVNGVATLIQAKMNSDEILSLTSKEAIQLKLLEGRPEFNIVKPSLPNVSFKINSVNSSATLYGGAYKCDCLDPKCKLAVPPKVTSDWMFGSAATVPGTTCHVTLTDNMAVLLAEILAGQAGHPFIYETTKKSLKLNASWSDLINYLLMEAQTGIYMATATVKGIASSSRRNQTVMHYQTHARTSTMHSFHAGHPQYLRHALPKFISSDDNQNPGGSDGGDIFVPEIGDGPPDSGSPSVILFEITPVG